MLDRFGADRQRRHLPKAALVLKGVLSPGPSDNLQGFFVARPALGLINTKSLKMLWNNTASGPEVKPAVAQDIEHGKVFGLAQRILKRQETDRRTQPNPRGLACHGGQKHLRTGANAKRIEVFLTQPDRVKAELLGLDADIKRILKIPRLVLLVAEKIKKRKQTKLHEQLLMQAGRGDPTPAV